MHESGNNHRGNWQQRLSPGSPEAYLAATVLVILASLVRWSLGFLGEDVFIFAAYYPAVLFATYLGGAAVGSFAATLGGVIECPIEP